MPRCCPRCWPPADTALCRSCPPRCAAKSRLRYGLIAGGVLLAFCLLMLAANAALTYTVVKMSQETTLNESGVLVNKGGNQVVGE